MKKNNKVVLAFSGGLDTSFCVKYLSVTKGLEVHTILINTGGFSSKELNKMTVKAKGLGAKSHRNLDKTEEFYERGVKYMIFGNILKHHTYPLSVSSERIFQAMAVAAYAQEIDASYIAHGSTGAGNDQVRFDLVFNILVPDMEIITPIRDGQLSRKQEIDYLKEHGVDLPWKKAKYSINQGLWGTSVGGEETLTSHLPLPDQAFPSQPDDKEDIIVRLEFEQGQPKGINGTQSTPVEVIAELNQIAGAYALGRGIHVGDTIIGIKGRVGFEAAAALLIIKAHEALEKHTLTKWQNYWKEQLGNWYGMLLHEGQYLDPVMRNIEKFLEDTQTNVTGEVTIKLKPGHFEIQGVHSAHDLMQSEFGQYGEMNTGWSGQDVRGFTKILANQTKIYHAVNEQ